MSEVRMVRLLALLSLLLPLSCLAEEEGGEARSLLHDTGRYLTAPLHWDEGNWSQFAVSVAAIAVAHEYDDNVRNHFAASATSNTRDTHETRDELPTFAMVGATWALAALLRDRDGYEEGRAMLESAGLTVLSTTLIKYAAGRRRPNETSSVDDWRNSGGSFPSMHSSTAFAVGTVLAESGNSSDRWTRRAIGYGLALATSYERVHGNAHWLSDTVAGAALGIATAQFTMNGRDERRLNVTTSVVPMRGGAMLFVSKSW
jgi:hypothetical protein